MRADEADKVTERARGRTKDGLAEAWSAIQGTFMKRFISAFFLLQVLKLISGLWLPWGWLGQPGVGAWARVPITVLMPTAVAVAVAYAMERSKPRRLFDARVRQPLTQIWYGALAGVINAVVGAILTRLIMTAWIDYVALAVAAAATALVVFFAIPRKRQGRCVACGAPYIAGESRCLNCFAENTSASGKGDGRVAM